VYEDYYRFRRQPFSPTPDPEFLYKSDSHQQALEQLLRGIRRREGMLLLTGDVGTGKTTTTRALLQVLDRDVFTALVLNPFVTADELLRVLLQDFGIVSDGRALQEASRQSLVETLNRFLLSLSAVGASALAVVDEAQNLAPAVLEQLRVLTALETDQQKLLQILLVGQPELQTLLASHEMRPLNQRIARRCTIRPLTRDEVEKYIGFRIRIARGAWETMFTSRAVDLIYQFSEGIPRKINLICDRALEAGFSALSPTIDEMLVAKAADTLALTRASTTALVSGRPQARFTAGQSGMAPQTKRWLATAAGVVAGVSIGAALTVLAPWTLNGGPAVPLPPPVLATLALPEPVVFPDGAEPTVGDDLSYAIHAVVFVARPPAEATAAMLRELGADAAVRPSSDEGAGYDVWVGPYRSLTDARTMETAIRRRFGFLDAGIVAGEIPQSP
jgi:type II secretory pathway predicted ATPase ExeA